MGHPNDAWSDVLSGGWKHKNNSSKAASKVSASFARTTARSALSDGDDERCDALNCFNC